MTAVGQPLPSQDFLRHGCFAPETGHRSARLARQKSARSRHRHPRQVKPAITPESADSAALLPEMFVEEACDFLERILALGYARVAVPAAVRHTFENLQHRLNAGLAQLAMHPHR